MKNVQHLFERQKNKGYRKGKPKVNQTKIRRKIK